MFKKVKHKFGAVRCESGGIKFPSKLEKNCWLHLKSLEKQNKIRMFCRQYPFDLAGGSVHRVDFCVFTEEHVLFIEAKGRDLAMGKLKRKQAEDINGIDIHVVKSVSDIDKVLKDHG